MTECPPQDAHSEDSTEDETAQHFTFLGGAGDFGATSVTRAAGGAAAGGNGKGRDAVIAANAAGKSFRDGNVDIRRDEGMFLGRVRAERAAGVGGAGRGHVDRGDGAT